MLMAMERQLRSKSFTLTLPPLTATESIALECITQIASECRLATQSEIKDSIGDAQSHSTATGIVNRLIEKGYLERIGGPLQKAMWLRIVATGEITAEPRDKTPHWRFRTERVQSPAIQRITERAKPLADRIEAKARAMGKPLSEFLMDCVYVGFLSIEEELS